MGFSLIVQPQMPLDGKEEAEDSIDAVVKSVLSLQPVTW